MALIDNRINNKNLAGLTRRQLMAALIHDADLTTYRYPHRVWFDPVGYRWITGAHCRSLR